MTDTTINPGLHLQQFADISLFWILKSEHVQPGLIHYLDVDDEAYVLMDDNDRRVAKCIEFLENKNCPIFTDRQEMDNYAQQLARGRRG